jgi:hypothetical protein
MPHTRRYRWHETCDSVLQESDPAKALPLFQRALSLLEMRFAELGEKPATKAELRAIVETISTLRRRLSRLQKTKERR